MKVEGDARKALAMTAVCRAEKPYVLVVVGTPCCPIIVRANYEFLYVSISTHGVTDYAIVRITFQDVN